MTATASSVDGFVDFLWTISIIVGFGILAVMAIRAGDRTERELLEEEERRRRECRRRAERPAVRIVEPRRPFDFDRDS